MSTPAYSFIDPLADVGREFTLAKYWDVYFDYKGSSNLSNRGKTNRRRKYYAQGSRFRILRHRHAVKKAAVGGKAYEVLLVLPIDDDGQTLFDGKHKIDDDFLDRVKRLTDIPRQFIDQFPDLKDIFDEYPNLRDLIDHHPDLRDVLGEHPNLWQVIDLYGIPQTVLKEVAKLKSTTNRDRKALEAALEIKLTEAGEDLSYIQKIIDLTQSAFIWSVYASKGYILLEKPKPVEEPEPEEPFSIEEIILQHKYPTLRRRDTGINVVTLQIWLRMLGFYTGPTSGYLDEATATAVIAFRTDRDARNIKVPAPADPIVVDWDTWEAMENVLKQRLPPDPYTLERLPFPRWRDYDTEEKYQKALYEGLKRFGFPIQPSDKRIEFRLTTGADGVGRLENLPPGEYELTIESLNTEPTGSAEIRLVDEMDLPLADKNDRPLAITATLFEPDSERSVWTGVDGIIAADGLFPGEYPFSVNRFDTDFDKAVTGCLEIQLFDHKGNPLRAGATVLLSGDMGDQKALSKAVQLFKAIGMDIYNYEDRNEKNLAPNLLTTKLEDNLGNRNIWDHAPISWGAFYGAPWMGILIDSSYNSAQKDSNWGMYDTIVSLNKVGNAYLTTAQTGSKLEQRLGRPIVLRHLANPLGGNIEGRSDFSQIGRHISFHIPQKASFVLNGRKTGQYYGSVNYTSQDYDRSMSMSIIDALIAADCGFEARSPDAQLVTTVINSRPLTRDMMTVDGFGYNLYRNLTAQPTLGTYRIIAETCDGPVQGAEVTVINPDGKDRPQMQKQIKTNGYGTAYVSGVIGKNTDKDKNGDLVFVKTADGFTQAKHLESITKFELNYPKGVRGRSQLPISAIFNAGQNAPDIGLVKPIDVLNEGKGAGSLSLGLGGSLLLEFDPPLIVLKERPFLYIKEEDVSEGYRVFGTSKADPSEQDPTWQELTRKFDGHEDEYVIFGCGQPKPRQYSRFSWIKVLDFSDTSTSEPKKPTPHSKDKPNKLGLDVMRVEGYRIIAALTVILDISGSMGDDEDGNFYRKEVEGFAKQENRLYYKTANALQKGLILQGADAQIRLCLITFGGGIDGSQIAGMPKSNYTAGSSLEGNNLPPPPVTTTNREVFQNYLKTIQDMIDIPFLSGTPFKSALQKGMDSFKEGGSTPKNVVKEHIHNVIIMITDGDGSPETENLQRAAAEIDPTGFGTLELINYYVKSSKYPETSLKEKRKLLEFAFTRGNNWQVCPHIVNTEDELIKLLEKLRNKYGL